MARLNPTRGVRRSTPPTVCRAGPPLVGGPWLSQAPIPEHATLFIQLNATLGHTTVNPSSIPSLYHYPPGQGTTPDNNLLGNAIYPNTVTLPLAGLESYITTAIPNYPKFAGNIMFNGPEDAIPGDNIYARLTDGYFFWNDPVDFAYVMGKYIEAIELMKSLCPLAKVGVWSVPRITSIYGIIDAGSDVDAPGHPGHSVLELETIAQAPLIDAQTAVFPAFYFGNPSYYAGGNPAFCNRILPILLDTDICRGKPICPSVTLRGPDHKLLEEPDWSAIMATFATTAYKHKVTNIQIWAPEDVWNQEALDGIEPTHTIFLNEAPYFLGTTGYLWVKYRNALGARRLTLARNALSGTSFPIPAFPP